MKHTKLIKVLIVALLVSTTPMLAMQSGQQQNSSVTSLTNNATSWIRKQSENHLLLYTVSMAVFGAIGLKLAEYGYGYFMGESQEKVVYKFKTKVEKCNNENCINQLDKLFNKLSKDTRNMIKDTFNTFKEKLRLPSSNKRRLRAIEQSRKKLITEIDKIDTEEDDSGIWKKMRDNPGKTVFGAAIVYLLCDAIAYKIGGFKKYSIVNYFESMCRSNI